MAKAEVNGSNTTSGERVNCPSGIWLLFKTRQGFAVFTKSSGTGCPQSRITCHKPRKGKAPVPSLITAHICVSGCQPRPVQHGADTAVPLTDGVGAPPIPAQVTASARHSRAAPPRTLPSPGLPKPNGFLQEKQKNVIILSCCTHVVILL